MVACQCNGALYRQRHQGGPGPEPFCKSRGTRFGSGRRVAAKVTVSGPTNYAVCLAGTSKNEQADLNEYLSFNVKRGEVYQIKAELDGKVVEKAFTMGTNGEAIAVVALKEPEPEPDQDHARLQVKLLDHLAGHPIAAKVAVTDILNPAVHFEGTSKDDQAGSNT